MTPRLDVIIVNWNTQAYLERCLAALFADRHTAEMVVWVVDNGSSDGSTEMVRRQFPEVRLIANRENAGFVKANNQVYGVSTGEYLLLLNSDAFVQPGCIQMLLDVMEQFPGTGAAGARLLNEDGSLQRSCYSFPTLATELWQTLWLDRLFPRSRVFGKYRMTYWAMDDYRVVDVVMGACMLVRRSALEGESLFDERFFMYSEEVDLCYRLHKKGWAVRYVPDARAVHIWGGSSQKVKAETLLRLYRSRVQFFRKHYGEIPAALYKGLLWVNSFTRWVSGRLVSALTHSQNLREKSQGYGQLFRKVHAF